MSKFLKKKLSTSLRLGHSDSGTVLDPAKSIPKQSSTVGSDDEFEDTDTALLHPDAHEEGGLACGSKELVESQRGIISDLVKQIGKQLLTGKLNLINVSLPVKMFEARSYLEKLCDVWTYSNYLQKAAHTTDAIERLKFVVTFFVAGIHMAFVNWRKPFNPILGETWQAHLPDGAEIYLEQVSHHPPVSAFQMVGPDSSYMFCGLSQPEVSAKLQSNAIKTTAKGYRYVSFRDGGAVKIVYPAYLLKGVLYGQLKGELAGTAQFIDKQHGLVATVTFGEVNGSLEPLLRRSDAVSVKICKQTAPTTGDTLPPTLMSSKLWHKPSLTKLAESVKGNGLLHRTASVEVPVASGEGNWLAYINFDGERYWTLCEELPPKWQPDKDPLQSDSRYRDDLQHLQAGRVQCAQDAKEWLEARQRRDKKLRQEGGWQGH